ncbi:hypothetical protein [Alsobacter sp. SYSU BS001988]
MTSSESFRFVLAIAVFLFGVPAGAHDTMADGNPSNDWLEGVRNGGGALCCGANDCRPIPTEAVSAMRDGELEVTIADRRYTVPLTNVLGAASPDGRAWACPDVRSSPGGFNYSVRGIRCLLLAPGS